MGQVRHLSRGVGAFVGFTWSSRIQGRSPSLPMVSCLPAGSRSGSLALTHSLLDLGRHRLVLEVFRSLRAVGLLAEPAAWPPWPFAPVQSSCPARAGPKSDLPLLGFVTVSTSLRAPPSRPFIDMASGVHSRLPFGSLRRRGSHPRRMFRPRGFAPPRRFPPPELRGLVASRCRSWGSSRFWRWPPRFVEIRHRAFCSRDTDLSPSRPPLFPRRSFVTLRRMSPLAAVPRHRGRGIESGR